MREPPIAPKMAEMVGSKPETLRRSHLRLTQAIPESDSGTDCAPRLLDPDDLPDYIDHLYRAARAMCGSAHDAEDLVQETLLNVLKRPRLLRGGTDLSYLLRALRNTYANHYRTAMRRPQTRELFDEDAPPNSESEFSAHEIMQAIASAPAPFRDAVIAVDVLGMSYREAARSLRAREATITTRVHRGRQHVARELSNDGRKDHSGPVSCSAATNQGATCTSTHSPINSEQTRVG